jgi:predicted helicase
MSVMDSSNNHINRQGMIEFVPNGGFINSGSVDGIKKSLTDEFSSIYIFHLVGNIYIKNE